ncbi:hypothetical protein AA12717_0424 [Gluconacetobacter sacchari DSM 12717]|uniref:Uncharacterized protein n=2 Tax=Gluconacetobacter sacchari TaxID=92759 RepID=A0A7W4NLN0_9PROT|nr:hypothetical protein [Gluconacetobacter sacchari]MBB2160061.1 hypothetical protein [Gluconacetobacter sacchari]GBQ19979.1 hypothetical protein AA12717_0424 [Gluconacetobacter sacchari DSM 12717]
MGARLDAPWRERRACHDETANGSRLPGRYDANGGRIAFTHDAARMQSGRNGRYAQFAQTVWHPRRGQQLLTLPGGLVFDTSGHSLQKNYVLPGFIWNGPLRSHVHP